MFVGLALSLIPALGITLSCCWITFAFVGIFSDIVRLSRWRRDYEVSIARLLRSCFEVCSESESFAESAGRISPVEALKMKIIICFRQLNASAASGGEEWTTRGMCRICFANSAVASLPILLQRRAARAARQQPSHSGRAFPCTVALSGTAPGRRTRGLSSA
jgi:hypothetical protein